MSPDRPRPSTGDFDPDPDPGLDIDLDYPRLLLVGLSLALLVGVVVAGTTSAAAFGVYNPGWEGVSDLRGFADEAGVEGEVLTNTSRYAAADPNATVAVVLSPDRAYTDREAARVRAFVERGGTLVVAEDFGPHSAPLLDAVGARTRFDGALLRDERSAWRSPAMPVATGVTNRSATPYAERVGSLTLNHGTVLDPGRNATVLARSSAFAYLDTNRNGTVDADESLAARPVAAVEPVGRGRVILVSDPSLFLNAMLEREGNRRFALNLFGSGERVLIDASHSTVPPLSVALLAVRGSPLLEFGLAAAVLSLVGAWGAGWTRRARALAPARLPWGGRPADRSPRVGKADVDVEALVAYLGRRHPEWDENRVRRVAQGVLPGPSESRKNE